MIKNTDNWVENYWVAMLNSDFATGIDLKQQHFPKRFFKYKNLSKWTIKSLATNTIHLAKMDSLNDPFESTLQFDNNECLRHYFGSPQFQEGFAKISSPLSITEVELLTTSPTPWKTYLQCCKARNMKGMMTQRQQLRTIQSRFSEILKKRNEDIKVTCFTQNSDSLLMWAHYADQHKGICMEYDLIDQHDIRPFLQPVYYARKVHKIGLFEEMDTMNLVCSSLVKSMEWKYEREWRATIFKQSGFFPDQITVPNPIAVYLGARFASNKESEKRKLINLLKRKKIPVYQMKRHPTNFKLISEPYNGI